MIKENLQNSSIYLKSLIAPTVLVLAMITITLISIFSLAEQRQAFQDINEVSLKKIALIDEFILLSEAIESKLFQISVLRLMGLPKTQTQGIKEQLEQQIADLTIIYKRILTTWNLDAQEESILNGMKEPMAVFARHTSEAAEVVSNNPAFGAILARSSLEHYAHFRSQLTHYFDYQKKKIMEAEIESAHKVKKTSSLIIMILVSITVSGILITFIVSKFLISRPIGELTQSMLKIASGNYSEKVLATVGNDEIGQMSRTVEIFRQNAIEKDSLEKKIRQSQKLESIGNLAGGIAHDFNNILSPILGYTEMILEDLPEESPLKDSLGEIYSASMRARDLVKQILTFSRQSIGEVQLVNMQYISKEVLKLIRSTIPTTIQIKQDVRSDCGVIKGDPTQIHQIIMNLTTNAFHAMEENGGEMKVSLKEVELHESDISDLDIKSGKYACLSVADTGVGMPEDVKEKIFDPFFTTKKETKGTGMGLSVVHGIVKNAGGAIQIFSEPGKGTEFHVYLPIAENCSEKKELQIKEVIQYGFERILLVDDEDAIIKMQREALERLGYQVTARTSSLEALKDFQDNPNKYDLIITDFAMPNMAGDKLAIELSKIRPDIPILLCTGFSENMSEEKALSAGIAGFLMKPVVINDFSHKIREVLDEAKGKTS